MSTEKTIQKPTAIAELKDMIVATGLSLPYQQERVARTALAYPEIVAFGTAQSLADRCGVSPSTVVRVATALGFDNFREFRQVFRQHIREISIRAANPMLTGKPQ
ncbi:MurR/RpiR family transcriptional regulator [Rhizobium leguminosarum]